MVFCARGKLRRWRSSLKRTVKPNILPLNLDVPKDRAFRVFEVVAVVEALAVQAALLAVGIVLVCWGRRVDFEEGSQVAVHAAPIDSELADGLARVLAVGADRGRRSEVAEDRNLADIALTEGAAGPAVVAAAAVDIPVEVDILVAVGSLAAVAADNQEVVLGCWQAAEERFRRFPIENIPMLHPRSIRILNLLRSLLVPTNLP
jgi:hypothetical protein